MEFLVPECTRVWIKTILWWKCSIFIQASKKQFQASWFPYPTSFGWSCIFPSWDKNHISVCQYPYIEKKIAKKKKYYSSLPQIITSVLETCNKCFLCFVSSFFRLRNIFPPYDKMVQLSIKGLDYHGVLE